MNNPNQSTQTSQQFSQPQNEKELKQPERNENQQHLNEGLGRNTGSADFKSPDPSRNVQNKDQPLASMDRGSDMQSPAMGEEKTIGPFSQSG